jgi:hypothetical protein
MDFVKIPTQQKKHNFIPENELRGKQLRDFVFAGNSLFTLLNEETGNHVTFRIKKHKEDPIWFVSTLGQYGKQVFIGTCGSSKKYKHSQNSDISQNDQKVVVFEWFLNKFFNNQDKYPTVKIYHHGRCGACYKTLTTPESIKSGIGPICGGKMRKVNR